MIGQGDARLERTEFCPLPGMYPPCLQRRNIGSRSGAPAKRIRPMCTVDKKGMGCRRSGSLLKMSTGKPAVPKDQVTVCEGAGSTRSVDLTNRSTGKPAVPKDQDTVCEGAGSTRSVDWTKMSTGKPAVPKDQVTVC